MRLHGRWHVPRHCVKAVALTARGPSCLAPSK
jgi:hypothetical protein